MLKRFIISALLVLLSVSAVFSAVPGRVVASGTQFQVCGNRIWLSGCNTPWDNWNDFGGTYDSAFWDNHFAALYAAGVNASRIWITCSGEVGINIDTAGNVTGATAAHWANLDDLFAKAQARGIYIMATLISFDHFKNTYTTYQRWRNWINSDANIDSYVNNYITPFLTRYGNNPALWSIDLCNEPEWASSTENTGEPAVYGAINWTRLQTYFAKGAVAIHKWNAANGGGPMVTTGMGYIKYNTDTRPLGGENKLADADLAALIGAAADKPLAKMDFWSTHYYPWQNGNGGIIFTYTPASFGLTTDRPAVVGECPNKYGSTNGLTNVAGYLRTDYTNGWNNGWQGIFPWTSNGAGSGDFGDLANELSGASNQMLTQIPTLVRPVCAASSPTFTHTRTLTATSTRTRTQTPANTNTFTRTVTLTPVNTNTFTRTVTLTPVNTGTFTRTVTLTPVNTSTFTGTATFTPENTHTRTPANTFTFTVTRTISPANTATFTATATLTFTRTNTAVNTPTYTATLTPTNVIFTPTITMTVIYTPSCPLLWSDEFDGAAVDTSKWVFETGAGGWGNNELEYYTGRTENARVESGNLVIEARAESYGGSNYTSARLKTQGKYSNKYGRIEARMKLPYGQGIWPAFWMLGDSISTVGWPACGEIDIMEMIGGGENRDDTTYGTAHWDSGGHAMYGGSRELADPRIFAEEYHIFGIEWDSTQIRWFLDGVQFHVIDITPADLSELQENAFILLNLAVGGNWPGVPDGTTVFPQKMYVDYVRWYGCALPTATPTFTRTPVNTVTRTMTATLTATSSRTVTNTPVNTATPSSTVTLTASVTSTQANTFTITQTPTGTPPTATPTYTSTTQSTATNTFTAVSTQTNTVVNTATPSNTATLTRTFTFTRTQTPSFTRTAVNTATRTATASYTPTRTSTLVSTAISTLTITPTNTPLPTATISWGDKFEIPNTLIYPNPCNPGSADLKIKISITQAASEMKVRIYTVGYRRILETECGAANEKEITATIPKERISRLSAGIYYVIVSGKSISGEKAVSKTQELIILK